MKELNLENTNLQDCVSGEQSELIMLTDGGQPVTMVVGISGMDRDQIEFGTSARFWDLIQERRNSPTITRAELETRLAQKTK